MTGRSNKSMPALTSLESLAEIRLVLLHSARLAVEAKDAVMAKSLRAKAETVQVALTTLRRESQKQWAAQARDIAKRWIARGAQWPRVGHGAQKAKDFSQQCVALLATADDLLRLVARGRP